MTQITSLFLGIGGVLLANAWDRKARLRTAELASIIDAHGVMDCWKWYEN